MNEAETITARTQRLATIHERKLAALEALKKLLLHRISGIVANSIYRY